MEEPHHEPQRLHTGQVRTLVMPLHALRQTIHLALCTLETLQKPTSLLYAARQRHFECIVPCVIYLDPQLLSSCQS